MYIIKLNRKLGKKNLRDSNFLSNKVNSNMVREAMSQIIKARKTNKARNAFTFNYYFVETSCLVDVAGFHNTEKEQN